MTGADERAGEPEHRAGGRLRDALALLLLVTAAAAFLAIIGYPRQWSQGLLINDEFWYAQLARSLYQGHGYVSNVMYPLQALQNDGFPVPEAMKQPGFQLVTALVWRVTGESVHAMLLVALAGLVAFAAGIYLLARHLGWGRGTALFVAAATIAHPVMAQYGVQALPESLYFACFAATLLFVLRGGIVDLLIAGALNAALMIVKGHGLIYIPVFVAYLWLRGAPDLVTARRFSPAKLRAVGTYVAACLATLLIAAALLPAGSVQLLHAGGTYSQGMLIEVGRATSDVPYLSVNPPPAWDYVLAHPGEYLGKVARMIKRTKMMIETLAGPALGGVLFPALLVSILLLIAGLVAPGRFLPLAGGGLEDAGRHEAEPYVLFAALLGWALLFFWPIYLSARFIIHLLPLMMLLCLYAAARCAPLLPGMPRDLRRLLVAAALTYFVAYPAAATVWDSYREPRKLLGSMLAVRHLDYGRMAANVDTRLPADAVIISDMAHEIAWLTGRRGIAFPNDEDDLAFLVNRFDVDAVYEHPLLHRNWRAITGDFVLVDDDNGFLWVRRRRDD